jgi:hypothetical protein
VNAQNTCHWDIKNPHTIHEVPLHDQKVGTWCSVSDWRIIGPIFFMAWWTWSIMWTVFLNCSFKCSLKKRSSVCISCRVTSQYFVRALYGIFGERLISWGVMARLFARFDCVRFLHVRKLKAKA